MNQLSSLRNVVMRLQIARGAYEIVEFLDFLPSVVARSVGACHHYNIGTFRTGWQGATPRPLALFSFVLWGSLDSSEASCEALYRGVIADGAHIVEALNLATDHFQFVGTERAANGRAPSL